ncbi:MAG: PEP-CTERM sorting domain-containing protein [Myxococcota bacterium]
MGRNTPAKSWRAALALGVALALPGTAAGLSVTGDIVELINAPPSVIEEGLESDSQIFLFLERSATTLGSPLAVNVTTPGTYTTTPGVSFLSAGSVVDSYFLHMDIVDSGDGGSTNRAELSGSIIFDRPILGIIGSDPELNSSDAGLGAPGTAYPTGVSGRDTWEAADSITLSADRLTLTIDNFRVFDGFTDQLRVIVVPEASTGSLLALGFVGLAWHGRRA